MSHAHNVAIPKNSTRRVRAFEELQARFAALRESKDPRDKKVFEEQKRSVLKLVSRSRTEHEVDQALARINAAKENRAAPSAESFHATAYMKEFSLKYANEEYIAEELLPTVPVDHLNDQFPKYAKRDRLAYPDGLMKGKSSANEITEAFSTDTYQTDGIGFKRSLEKKSADNADDIFDLMMDLQEHTAEALAFDREKRGMTILTDSANYGANTAALGAGVRWDVAGGTPIKAILDAGDQVWRGRGPSRKVGFCTLAVYRALCVNPTILDVLKYTSAGTATKDQLVQLFQLDDLLIAKAWQDTANSGQAQSISRMTTQNVFGIVRVANRPTKNNISFGYNFRFKGDINHTAWFKAEDGTRGVYWDQQTCDEVFKVVASDAGYLLTTVIG